MIKNYFRILKKTHAYLQTILKTPVKFQKDRTETVGGVKGTKYLLKTRNHAPRPTENQKQCPSNFLRKGGGQQVLPVSQMTDSSPIQFSVRGQNGMEFIDTRNSFMGVKAKIVHADGKSLTSTEFVGPVNLLVHALFEQVDVSVQGKFITSATGHYPYRAMIQTLLKYGNDAKSSRLSSQMYYKDTPGFLDDNDAKTGDNDGFKKRANLFADSKTVHMIAPIIYDVFQLDRYILNQVPIDIKYYRAKPEFYLMTDFVSPDFKVHIEEMVLHICKVQVNPAVILAQSHALENTNAKYPYIKTEVRMFALSQGQVNFSIDNVFQGIKPNKLWLEATTYPRGIFKVLTYQTLLCLWMVFLLDHEIFSTVILSLC